MSSYFHNVSFLDVDGMGNSFMSIYPNAPLTNESASFSHRDSSTQLDNECRQIKSHVGVP